MARVKIRVRFRFGYTIYKLCICDFEMVQIDKSHAALILYSCKEAVCLCL